MDRYRVCDPCLAELDVDEDASCLSDAEREIQIALPASDTSASRMPLSMDEQHERFRALFNKCITASDDATGRGVFAQPTRFSSARDRKVVRPQEPSDSLGPPEGCGALGFSIVAHTLMCSKSRRRLPTFQEGDV